MDREPVTIAGAGVLGLWQAVTLARAGRRVTLVEDSATPFANAASRWAGAMLAPDCEAEAAPPIVRDLGRSSIAHWQNVYPALEINGTLIVAPARDMSELSRFARATERHRIVDDKELARLEPDLVGRFDQALYFPEEAHFNALEGLKALLEAAKKLGVMIEFGKTFKFGTPGITIDCRGLSACNDLKDLRGVRGERLLIQSRDVTLTRPIRLLHPRQPIYVVPQGGGRFVVGATVVEREDDGPMTARSALELLGSAYALHPAFGEAAILDMGAGVRPAFPDNVPRIVIEDGGRTIRVNGAYRHGFLLAPVLAEAVADFLATGKRVHPLIH